MPLRSRASKGSATAQGPGKGRHGETAVKTENGEQGRRKAKGLEQKGSIRVRVAFGSGLGDLALG